MADTTENKDVKKPKQKPIVPEALRCSFCGAIADTSVGRMLVSGPNVHICTDCIDTCMDAKSDWIAKNTKGAEALLGNGFKPITMKNHIDQYVIRQEYAKKIMSVAIYNHYKMLKYKQKSKQAVELEKSNILLLGPTGSGKTYLLKTIAKALGVPFATQDANSLTAAG